MQDIIVLGAGGFGREVVWLIERINKQRKIWNILGFLDNAEDIQGKQINGYKVLGTISEADSFPEAFYVCAIGSPKTRKRVISELKHNLPNIRFATLIDPTVEMSEYVTIGSGTVICAHTIMTVNISIGDQVIVNLDCTIGHDVVLEDYVTLSPSVNLSGGTRIGTCSEIGTGAHIIQYKEVGRCSAVGAGAVVIDNIPDYCVAVGVPAHRIS